MAMDDTLEAVKDILEIDPPGQFNQPHEDLIPEATWWWAVSICLCSLAVIGNLLFVITVIYNRKRHDLKTFVTAVTVTIAVLDIVDIARILPAFEKSLFENQVYRHTYCTLGVFHELSVAIFLISLAVAVCVLAGRVETKHYADPRASVAQKILIPVVLMVAAGAACPLYLLPYERLGHSCTDPFKAQNVLESDSNTFYSDLYSTIVSVFVYAFPILILPLALPIACLRTCIARQCCIARFKQPIGELIMTIIICLIYLATIVGVSLPRLDQELKADGKSGFGEGFEWGTLSTPLLWEIANNALRPICYFLINPGVWDGLKSLCGCCGCQRKHQLVNGDDMEEAEALSPIS